MKYPTQCQKVGANRACYHSDCEAQQLVDDATVYRASEERIQELESVGLLTQELREIQWTSQTLLDFLRLDHACQRKSFRWIYSVLLPSLASMSVFMYIRSYRGYFHLTSVARPS